MAVFSQESLARIEQAIHSHEKGFCLTPECIEMSFTYGEHLTICADEEGYLCINQRERSTSQFRFPDEEAAVAYFIRFIPLAMLWQSGNDHP